MAIRIRGLQTEDVPELVSLALRAWAPVFDSLRHTLGDELFDQLRPDWRRDQEQAVRAACEQPDRTAVHVADDAGAVVGFVASVADDASRLGVVELLAVDPARQRTGIGTLLTQVAFASLREAGMQVAMVETGGDPGHEPARRTYQRAGCTLLPIARYFTTLDRDPKH